MAVGAVLIFLLYKPLPRVPRPGDLTFAQQMYRFDWIGAGLFIVFVLPLMMAIIWYVFDCVFSTGLSVDTASTGAETNTSGAHRSASAL